ncbi:MAG: hypothetical protein ACRDKU_07160 [Gaiellaceae bacterium]
MGDTLMLPQISEIDEADDLAARFGSALDDFTTRAEKYIGNDVKLDDAAFLLANGIAVDERPRHADPALFARLLVFADDALDEAERIAEDARRLRRALLVGYREFVIDGRRREDV